MCVGMVALGGVIGALADGLRFQFGTENAPAGWTLVGITNFYIPATGYGFEHVSNLGAGKAFVASDEPFLFSVRLPEGNYLVSVTLGSDVAESVTTIKAEARRLMVERLRVPRRESVQRQFIVNVHTPQLPDGGQVRLKRRELETERVSWDGRLTLEFNGISPSLRALEIVPTNVPTIFVTGDSTVCDQPREPWNSWGQMLPRFFGPAVAVANYAESGESLNSSLGARRFEKVFSQMKSNDWLFVQFGHNDMKDRATNALAAYKENLKMIVDRTRQLGATPVLVTSMERKAGVTRDTLAGYPQAMREVARAEAVALVDLHAMSKTFYRALGGRIGLAFQDGTHHNNYGSYELARCVVAGIRSQTPRLAVYLAADAGEFDPARPDDPGTFNLPASPIKDETKPDGD